VGLSREAFTASVAFGQGVTRFARMTDRERKTLLETMLGFDAFARALDVTRAKLTQARSDLALVESDLTRVGTAKSDYEAEVKRVRAEIETWEAKEKARLYEVEKKLSAARKRLEKLESAREEASDAGLAESEATVKALRAEEAGLLRFDDPRPALEQRLKVLEKRAAEVGRKGPCPTCGAGLTPEQRAKIQQDFQLEAESIAAKIDAVNEADEGRKAKLRKLRERLGREEARLQTLREARQKANARKAEIGAVQREIVALEGSIEAGSEAPLADVLERAESKLRLVTEKQAALGSLLPGQRQTVERLEFWEAGFGLRGLRSLALDEVLPRFEALAGAYLERLTGSALEVRLSAISNLKGGGSKDALAVEVENSAGAGTYRGQSAGERARVDLALALALFDLTRERVGGVGFVFFDEAFEALDDAGCEAVARLLARESRRWGRVFVVSHLDALAGYFREALEVVKEGGVSRIEGTAPARRKIATATVK
jgi:DNA repair exonuclease SbcCD ATPase subunit